MNQFNDEGKNINSNCDKQSLSIRVAGLSKSFNIYKSPQDRLKQMILPRARKIFGLKNRAYHEKFWALRDITFTVCKGETVGIIGRNGSGKSTLLQIICGTLTESSGSIETFGRVAALLELGSGFNPEFTGRENVYMNATILGLQRKEIDNRFKFIADFAGIGKFIDQPTKTYSSGMVVRLAFSVAVCISPDILVIDEALAVGDAVFQAKCFERLKELRESGTTILFVSHSIEQVLQLCSRSILLHNSKIIAEGDPCIVAQKYREICTKDWETKSSIENNTREPIGLYCNFITSPELSYFGSDGARISGLIFTSEPKGFSGILFCGDKYEVSIIVNMNERVDSLVVAFQLFTKTGISATGMKHITNRKLEKGAVISLRFKHQIVVEPGSYLLGASVATLLEGEMKVLQRLRNITEILVMDRSGSPEIGYARSPVGISCAEFSGDQ